MAEANLEDKKTKIDEAMKWVDASSPPQRRGSTTYPNTGHLRITTITMYSDFLE